MHLGTLETRRPVTSGRPAGKDTSGPQKKHIDDTSMPDFATVHFPRFAYAPEGDAFEQMERDDIAMKCLFTLQAVRTVHVECTADALTYVRCAVVKAELEDRQTDGGTNVFHGRERGAVRQASQDGARRRAGVGYAEWGEENPGEAFRVER
eukprot:6444309-Pyramimonas_sp.AAC.1